MAIYFSTRHPKALLDAFKEHIAAGRITAWEADSDGDFTLTAPQWGKLGWMVPEAEGKQLIFHILHPKGRVITTPIYAIYHGRLIESMLRHCDSLFSESRASSLPEGRDRIQTKTTDPAE